MKRTGFTLIELIVVIAIIAVLAAIVAPSAFKAIEKGKVSATIGDYKSIKTSAMAFYADVGQWPANMTDGSGAGFINNSTVPNGGAGWDGPYLEKWPAQAQWGGDYYYYKNATARYLVVSNVTNATSTRIDTQVDGADGAAAGSIQWTGTNLTMIISTDS
jgi:general secretion pathway protein G